MVKKSIRSKTYSNIDSSIINFSSSGSPIFLPTPTNFNDAMIIEELNNLDEELIEIVKSEKNTGTSTDIVETGIRKRQILLKMDELEWRLEKSRVSFYTSLIIGIITFFLVVFIISFGLYLTYLQFNSINSSLPNLLLSTNNLSQPNSEISLSANEIKIQTSIIGVIILSISSLFFFLYLKYAYISYYIENDTNDK
jgi:hypothetical protein